MEITEVRVRLVRKREDRLRAFCSMTIDDEFVIRDIKIIEGTKGYFVAMPCRKISDRCGRCGEKNHLRAAYCNGCGHPLPANRRPKRGKDSIKFHADVAHPISLRCRRSIQDSVVRAFQAEVKRSKRPGYRPVKLDDSRDNVLDTA